MKHLARILPVFAIILLIFNNLHCQEKPKVYQGFDGGMMIHSGFLSGNISPVGLQAKGAPVGLGGVVRVHLGSHCMIGSEGYVSTLRQLRNGSYIRYGWGGLLTEFYWPFKVAMPYAGLTIGGGSQTMMLLLEGDSGDWQKEDNAVFHKQGFFALSPFLGCDFIISQRFHLTLKADYLCPISHNKMLTPNGVRLFVGFVFYH